MVCALVKRPMHAVVIFNNMAQFCVIWHLNPSCGLFSAKLLLYPTPKYFGTNMLAFIQNNVSNLSSI